MRSPLPRSSLDQRQPVEARQHAVDDQHVVAAVSASEARLAVLGEIGGVAALLQRLLQELGGLPVVLDHQHAHGSSTVSHVSIACRARDPTCACAGPNVEAARTLSGAEPPRVHARRWLSPCLSWTATKRSGRRDLTCSSTARRPGVLGLLDAGDDILRRRDRLARTSRMTSPALQALLRGVRVRIDLGDHDAVLCRPARRRRQRQAELLQVDVAVGRRAASRLGRACRRLPPCCGNVPSFTLTVCSLSLRQTLTSTVVLGGRSAILRARSRLSSIFSPLTCRIASSTLRPASAAGPFGRHLAESAPLGSLEAEAAGDVLVDVLDLHAEPAAADARRPFLSCSTTSLTVSAGTAKAMPTLPPDGL